MDLDKCQLKGIVLGDSSVGKTCLLNQFVRQQFSLNYRATIGADFLSKEILIENKFVAFQLWDTAGQERFKSLGTSFYRGADCCLLVYDITNRDSFDNIVRWKQEFLMQCEPEEPEKFPVILLGNKCDLEEARTVSTREAQDWADSEGLVLYEASAKDNLNVQEAFYQAAVLVLRRDAELRPKAPERVNLAARRKVKVKKNCC